MLFHLAQYLQEFYSGFNVFNYLTLRAILGVLTALLISFIVPGPATPSVASPCSCWNSCTAFCMAASYVWLAERFI